MKKTKLLCNLLVVYKFSHPRCNTSYVGKMERTLKKQLNMLGQKDGVICKHPGDCSGVQHMFACFEI